MMDPVCWTWTFGCGQGAIGCPLAVALPGLAAADFAFPLGYLVAAMILWGLTNLLSWYIAGRYYSGRNAEHLDKLDNSQARLVEIVDRHDKDIVSLRLERSRCELRAVREFATHAEIAQVIADNTAKAEKIYEMIEKVHGRITEVANEQNRLAGLVEGLKQSEGRKPDDPA